MIPDRWYAIAESRELRPGRPLRLVRFGERLALWRDASGRPQAVQEDCPHRGASLAKGRVVDGEIACPFHGFQFDGSGRCTRVPAHPDKPIPASLRTRAWVVQEAHGFLWVWTGAHRDDLPPIPWFEEPNDRYVYAGFTDDWPIHYMKLPTSVHPQTY